MSRSIQGQKRNIRTYAAVLLLLLLLFALLTLGARRLSLTQDEPSHIVGGYTLLARGKAGFWTFPARGHPPLINVLEALLLFMSDPHVPLERMAGWGENYVQYVADWRSYLAPVERTELLGRTPVIFFALLLAAVVFRWTRQLGGTKAGLLALTVLVFDPLLLAHGRLATNDVGVTALGTLALYVGWRWFERPGWRRAGIVGGLLGLTALAKASGVLWTLAFGGMALLALTGRPTPRERLRLGGQALLVGGVAFALTWAAYGFSVGPVEALPFSVPAPEHWVQLLRHTNVPTWRVFWALGRLWRGRQWWYYPLNFVIRNPLPFLLGLLLVVFYLFRRGFPKVGRTHLAIAVFPVFYTLVAVARGTSVGYRHLLPVHPFLYLLLGGGLWVWVRNGPRWRWGLMLALGVWYGGETLWLFPHEITYFNQLVGGPEQGYRYLVDYTQDWGQSFKALRAWLEHHPGPEPGVSYYTYVHPGHYGVDFHPLPPAVDADPLPTPWRPPAGRYVIGVTPLQGIVGRDRMTFEWFRHANPTARVGHVLHVYDVRPFRGQWVAQCHVPAAPLTGDAIQEGLGLKAARQLAFDCEQAWVYPAGGRESGWYALHGRRYAPPGLGQQLLYEPPQPRDPFLARRLEGARFAYQQEQAGLLPAFVLYEATEPPTDVPRVRAWSAPAETPPTLLDAASVLSAPVSLEGPLDFVGVEVLRDGETWEVESWWRVSEGPVSRPVSLMAHLVASDGRTLGVADGLGLSPLVWAPGDLLVQRHVFTAPAVDGDLWLRMGAYWLDDGRRWPVAGVAGADALFVPLAP